MELPRFDKDAKVRPTDISGRRDFEAERVDFDQVPVIDIGAMMGDDEAAKKATANIVREAAANVGFFYVKNHGVPDEVIEAALKAANRFYELPLETKCQYDVSATKRHKGYVPVGGLSADPEIVDLQEGYEVGLELPEDDPDFQAGSVLLGPNIWPAELPEFQRDVYRYFEESMALGKRLYRLFALALDLPEDFFEPMVTKPCAQLRILYYPDTEPQKAEVGIGPHTDYESFTLLWQSQAGLQVQNRAGQWIEAPPIPGTFIINIADMMMRWTNDLFVSTPHRVINLSGKKRYSMALFFAANHDTIVECLPSCTNPANPPKYPPTHFGYWIENMHSYSYAYRWDERGKLPDPEEAAQALIDQRSV
ncbi:MAG: 2-oxoglutarate and iron-dependent oxygenase domain-containing protein [Pseudomonadota bacterium]